MSKELDLLTKSRKENKLAYQRCYRAAMKEQGKGSRRLPEEVKAANAIIRKEKQKIWLASEEGQAFIMRQAAKQTKFASPRERDAARNMRRKDKKAVDLEYNLMHRIVACKQRASREGLLFDLDLPYLLSIYQPVCPYLGIELRLTSSSGNSMDALSIDKIIPELGYTKGNVQIISYKANVMKQDVSLDVLRRFAKSVLALHGDE